MPLPDETTEPVVNRLKRAHGQLSGVIRMLEEASARSGGAFTCEHTPVPRSG